MIGYIKLLLLTSVVLVTALLFVRSSTHPQTALNIDDTFYKSSTSGHLFYLLDSDNQFSAEQVRTFDMSRWQQVNKPSLNLGVQQGSVWFQFRLSNTYSEDLELVLLNSYAPTDKIELFMFDMQDNLLTRAIGGDRFVFDARDVPHASHAFDLTLKPASDFIVLLKVESEGNMIVPLTVWSASAFTDYQISFYLIFGTLVGILFITSVYNCFVYLQTRESLFLNFSFFIISVAFLVLHQSGMGLQFLWPDSPGFNQFAAVLSISLASLGHIVFSQRFLNLSGIWKGLCIVLAGFSILFSSLYSFVAYSTLVKFGLINGVLLLILSFTYAIFKALQADKNARVYLLAWTPFIFGTIISASIRFDLIEYSVFTEFAGLFCAVITIVWLSMAIAERINREKSSRIRAQKSAIENLQRFESLYENSVEGLYTTMPNGELISANRALVNILGFKNKASLFEQHRAGIQSLYKHPQHREALVKKVIAQGSVVDEEVELLRADGRSFWASISLRLTKNNEDDIEQIEGSMIDVTSRKVSEMKLAYLASHDPLTNLLNRREFESQLKEALEQNRLSQLALSVLYMDLDQFKIVNDTCGHTVGDKLLKQLTVLMTKTLANRGILARLGGDEFGLILKGERAKEAYNIASELLDAVGNYMFAHQNRVFSLGMSIGMVEVTAGFSSIEDIMSFADTACYAAKDAGRNRIHVYSSDNIEFDKHRREMELATVINQALANNHFRLHRQKVVFNNEEKSLCGYEMLLRMESAEGVLVSPADFIPAAERFGLMSKIDKWVIAHTFNWLAQDLDKLNKLITCSINLSGQSLGNKELCTHLHECFERFGIPHSKIAFEITETQAMENVEQTIDFIQTFQSLGCKFSLDDFGSGLSSYGYLKTLPIDNVKIDGRFVKSIVDDSADFAMVESIHKVAHAMGKKTIAEYVEDEHIVKQLQKIGIDYLQGFGIHRPEAIDYDYVIASSQGDAENKQAT
uniref:EAL domain-containing protein n=1 Tax=Ningiella ruwaisensis TaxID=2364274 RepID=UPI001445FA6E|nr:EAL domain-containing protein [Ningiella ruwaisensis]